MKKRIFFAIFAMVCWHMNNNCTVHQVKSAQEFNAILTREPIVVAEFFTPGCPHCRNFNRSGIFDALARELPNYFFAMVSTDDAESLHHHHGITAYPTFFVFQNGRKVGKRMGFQHREPLKKFINESIVK
jgi:thioredoxin-like negative regulator of GroEL